MITYNGYLSLTYFTKHNTLQVYQCSCKWQSFLFMAEWYFIACVYHIFLIHLAIANNSTTNIGMHYLFQLVFSFSLDKYSEVESVDHMVFLFFSFLIASILCSIVAVPIYIPTNSVLGLHFLYIFASICYLWSVW